MKMTDSEQTNQGSQRVVVIDYLSDPGLHRIPCYTLLHHTEVLSFICGLSVAKYQHLLSAMKNQTVVAAQKSLIDRAVDT